MPLFPAIPKYYRDWFAAFGRLEARSRSKDFDQGLQAQTADPLWMLARQWQVGEFQGEDAGSPIEVYLRHSTQAIEHIRLGEAGQVMERGSLPLELLVESETIELNWRDRVQIGQEFERLVKAEFTVDGPATVQAVIQWYRDNHGLARPVDAEWLDIDRATRRLIEFMAEQATDGKPLLEARPTPPQSPEINADHITRLAGVLDRLEDWCDRANLYVESTRPEAWRGEQLDYRFDLNPPDNGDDDKTHLQAPDYRNGDLDWYTLGMASEEIGMWTQNDAHTITPTRITVAGNSPRWWAFEDAVTDFGKLDTARPDLAKLVLMEFALIYGDDWFSVPLPVQISNLARIEEMNVRDVFGETTPVQSARKNVRDKIVEAGGNPNDPLLRWELFTLTQPETVAENSDALFVPATVSFREESPPLEEIRFLRDEGANMVWGVEHTVRNGLGLPVDGFDTQLQRAERRREADIEVLRAQLAEIQALLDAGGLTDDKRTALEEEREQKQQLLAALEEGTSPPTSGAPLYRLASTVPENWIPFVPANASPYRGDPFPSIRLLRAQMLRNADNEEPEAITAMSRLLELSGDPLLWLEEANVPRAGRRIQLTAQRVRWVDGQTYVWWGRKVTAGRGEGSSGLKFDTFLG